jgi:NAD(P)-dependent dehydrogenase (short-subunit alcohol dehydrogenase family)
VPAKTITIHGTDVGQPIGYADLRPSHFSGSGSWPHRVPAHMTVRRSLRGRIRAYHERAAPIGRHDGSRNRRDRRHRPAHGIQPGCLGRAGANNRPRSRRGAAAAAQIHARTGRDQVSFIQVDHLTVGANQLLAEQIRNSLDRLDILVNNVGRVFAARQETADGYEATLALCFVGPVALTEAVLPLLTQSRGARVVNMSSSAYKMWHHHPFDDIQSQRSYVGIQAHAHAKLLNLIWTFALAARLKEHGVAVNATNPGAAWTPGTAQLTPEAIPPGSTFGRLCASSSGAARQLKPPTAPSGWPPRAKPGQSPGPMWRNANGGNRRWPPTRTASVVSLNSLKPS